MHVTDADDGATIELAVGGRIDVVLPEEPASDPSWAVASIDSDIVASVCPAVLAADPTGARVGVPEDATHASFAFDAVERGSTDLGL